jgi:hypothetical protein
VNLVLTNYLTGEKSRKDDGKIRAAQSILALLSQIDFKAEVVPENNLKMFTRLLTSLKGEPLDKEESELVEEIINY